MMDFKRLIPDNSVLNGMPLRLLVGFIPENTYDMNVQTGTLTAFRRGEILQTAFNLDKLTGNVDVKPLSDRMYQWSKRQAELAKESNDKVADYIRRRIMFQPNVSLKRLLSAITLEDVTPKEEEEEEGD